MTTLWIIAAIAGAVLVLSIAFLVLGKRESEQPLTPVRGRETWDDRPDELEGTRIGSVPPPSGVPRAQLSEELSGSYNLGSQELFFEEDEPTGPVAKILVKAAGGTHAGRKRELNEDAYVLLSDYEVYAIADGMGGYAAGEVASGLAMETLRDAFAQGDFGTLDEGFPRRGAELVAAIKNANTRIRVEAQRDAEKAGMGTTIVVARFSPGRQRVYIAHVGDSRCYRIREGRLKQLTHDHTLGAAGIQGPGASKLSRAVGAFDQVDVELTIDEPAPGDFFLLCSDGLYKMVDDTTIQDLVAHGGSLDETVAQLIRVANERGGRDNVSVVLLRVDEPDFSGRESGEHRIHG